MNHLLAAHRHTSDNRAEIEASAVCGCFHCIRAFAPSDIVAWAGLDVSHLESPDAAAGGTALCPRCGSESVIGDKSGYVIDAQFLIRMHDAWFEKTIIRKPGAGP